MYQRYGDILTISVNDWIAAGLTYDQFRMDSQRGGQLSIVKRGINGNTLIDVKSIKRPDRRAAIEAAFGSIEEQDKKPSIMDIVIDEDARMFFRDYTYTDESGKERHLPEDTQRQYTNEASIFNMFRRVYNKQIVARATNGKRKTKKEFFSECIKQAEILAEKYTNKLPSNVRSLERKYEEYTTNGYESLINKLYGNKNSGKITEDAKYWIIARYATPVDKVTTQQLLAEYNQEAAKHEDWKTLSSEQTI